MSNDKSLAIAYSVKRKPKKMAKGGMAKNESASSESRPSPEQKANDSKQIAKNSGNKPPKHDSWTDNSTIEQAQRPSKTPLSRPKLVGSDAFSVRYKDEIDQDLHRMDSMPPASDKEQPKKAYDEIGASRQGPKVPDMASQHNNSKPPYNKAIEDQYAQDVAAAEMKKVQSYAAGGIVEYGNGPEQDNHPSMSPLDGLDDMKSPPEDEFMAGHFAEGGEIEMEHEDSIAAAIMAKKERQKRLNSDSDEDKMVMMAEGGEIHSHDSIYSDDSSEVDLSRNADEDANEEDQVSFNALRKENYSESEGLAQLDQPEDSNLKGDSREDASEDKHDKMRARMNLKRQFKQR